MGRRTRGGGDGGRGSWCVAQTHQPGAAGAAVAHTAGDRHQTPVRTGVLANIRHRAGVREHSH